MFNKSITPFVIAFLVIGAVILIFRNFHCKTSVDWQVLSGANLFIYMVTVVSVNLLSSGLQCRKHAIVFYEKLIAEYY